MKLHDDLKIIWKIFNLGAIVNFISTQLKKHTADEFRLEESQKTFWCNACASGRNRKLPRTNFSMLCRNSYFRRCLQLNSFARYFDSTGTKTPVSKMFCFDSHLFRSKFRIFNLQNYIIWKVSNLETNNENKFSWNQIGWSKDAVYRSSWYRSTFTGQCSHSVKTE